MSNWQAVRHDPTYTEPLDPEVIPLCDALNAAGFVTTTSCSGHGYQRPCIWFEHSDDKRIESMARFVLEGLHIDYGPHTVRIRKEIHLDGEYSWSIDINCWDINADTPNLRESWLKSGTKGMGLVAYLIGAWSDLETREKFPKRKQV